MNIFAMPAQSTDYFFIGFYRLVQAAVPRCGFGLAWRAPLSVSVMLGSYEDQMVVIVKRNMDECLVTLGLIASNLTLGYLNDGAL